MAQRLRPAIALLGAVLVLGGATIAFLRGGLIGWSTLLIGFAVLVKHWRRPGPRDLSWLVAVALGAAALWGGTYWSVISAWESGEVVELGIDLPEGARNARVWVMDRPMGPVVYFDAPPELAAALLAGRPLRYTRGGVTSTRIPKARPVAEVPEAEAAQILQAMQDKYAERYAAAGVYYLLLGRYRDRVELVVELLATQ